MTATGFSLAELRAAYTALQNGTFADLCTDFSTPVETDHQLALAGRVVGVVGVSAGIGTTTVALAVAETLGASRLVELAASHASGLAAASTAELGTRAGWNLGQRNELRLERRLTPDATIPALDDDDSDGEDVTVVDLGTVTQSIPAAALLVVVAPCSVPGIRRLNACLTTLNPTQLVVVVTGAPGRTLPRQVAGAFAPALRAAAAGGRVLVVPECPALRLAGVTADPLPRLLRTALAPIPDLLEDFS